jgi:hypothetical protein
MNALVLVGDRFENVTARRVVGTAGRLLARGAIAAVLAVLGCALMLMALAVLDAAPLAVVAGIVVASWRASARLTADLDRG